MLDVTAVGSDLTPEQQDETIADLAFFLDEFGSTQAVRVTLQEQKSAVQRLRSVQSLPVDEISQEDEKDRIDDEMAISTIAGGDVDQTMADLDFFLDTFGSTRAVWEKLQSQKLEITKLQSAIEEEAIDNDDSISGFSPSRDRGRRCLASCRQDREKRKRVSFGVRILVKLAAVRTRVELMVMPTGKLVK